MVEMRRKFLKFFVFEIVYIQIILIFLSIILSLNPYGILIILPFKVMIIVGMIACTLLNISHFLGWTDAWISYTIIIKNELDCFRETESGIYIEYKELAEIFKGNREKIKELKTFSIVNYYGLYGRFNRREFKLSI